MVKLLIFENFFIFLRSQNNRKVLLEIMTPFTKCVFYDSLRSFSLYVVMKFYHLKLPFIHHTITNFSLIKLFHIILYLFLPSAILNLFHLNLLYLQLILLFEIYKFGNLKRIFQPKYRLKNSIELKYKVHIHLSGYQYNFILRVLRYFYRLLYRLSYNFVNRTNSIQIKKKPFKTYYIKK